jgi:hypothetical protein
VRVYAAATASRKLRGVGGEAEGTMRYAVVDVEEIPVPPESKRQPAAGPAGMSFLVIGGVPGGVYEPWPLPEE